MLSAFLSALVLLPLVQPDPVRDAQTGQALRATAAPIDAVQRADAVQRFDARELLSLSVGDALPGALDAFGGHGLRLVRRSTVDAPRGAGPAQAPAQHFVFEHPLSPAREASLVVREGRLYGRITAGAICHELRADALGPIRPTLRAPAEEPSCGGVLARPNPARGPGDEVVIGGVAGTGCDDGSRIDVFVGYTEAALSQAGGAAEILDRILWAVGDSNAIYASSGIAVTLRLVGTQRADGYLENSASMANDLYALQDPADGPLDAVHAAGVAAGADLIALVRADGGGACGIAFLVGASASDVGYGVSVTALGCFTNRTFTHELGHNMGCCHAPGDGGGCTSGGVYLYSTGHRFTGASGATFRTVMAYAPGTRIGRFSSPIVTFEGTPTGIADERDNARSINETRFFVSNFRCEVCLGDTNLDGAVDGADLTTLLNAWGGAATAGDLNGDGTIDASDLAALLANWGACD